MKIDLKHKNKVIGSLTISQEDHDCMASKIFGTPLTKLVHFSDKEGNFRYIDPDGKVTDEEEGNEPLMNHEIQYKDDGTMRMNRLPVEEWAQRMYVGLFDGKTDDYTFAKVQQILDDKFYACKNRMR